MNPPTSSNRKSIVTSAMTKLGVRVALVIVVVTSITYFHVTGVVEKQTLEQLEKYTIERAKNESAIFEMARDGHAKVRQEVLLRLAENTRDDPRVRFNREVERFPDGATRTRLAGFNGDRESFIFIGKQTPINADTRRRAMLLLDLSNRYGPAWHHRFEDFYFTTPDNILVGYWPGYPTWAHDAPANLDMSKEEYVYVADRAHNPERKTVWTGLYYDEPSDKWLVSTETPVDLKGRQIATIGSDITLNRLMSRTINNRLEGTRNIIFREDGRLIAHPELIDDIKAAKGRYDISDSDNVELKTIYNLVKNREANSAIIESNVFDNVLAVQKLAGPGWFFVTVYPESLLKAAANSTARIVLLVGVLSLLVELMFLYLVMNREVSVPLGKLVTAVNQIADGDNDIKLDHGNNDELGRISGAVAEMAKKIRNRTSELRQAHDRLEEKVEERTQELKAAQDSLIKKERLATLGQLTATVSHELRNPLATIMTSLHLIKRGRQNNRPGLIDKSTERIQRNAQRCDQIIDELLDFTRVSDLNPQAVKIDDWLRHTLDELDIPDGVELRIEEGAENTRITLDPGRMQRAVINVVNNACQAMADEENNNKVNDGALLVVATSLTDHQVKISFTDNGMGMDQGVLQKLFEPLFSTKGFGIGLGMSAIEQIMKQHKGGIEVASTPDIGTTVNLWLPR